LVETVTMSPDDLWGHTFLAVTLSRTEKKLEGQRALAQAISMGLSRASLTAVTAGYHKGQADVLCKSLDALEIPDW
jgi:methylaspartate ammonia-lyase